MRTESLTASRKPALTCSMTSSTYCLPLTLLRSMLVSSMAMMFFASSVGHPNCFCSTCCRSSLVCISVIFSCLMACMISSGSFSMVTQARLCLLGDLPRMGLPW